MSRSFVFRIIHRVIRCTTVIAAVALCSTHLVANPPQVETEADLSRAAKLYRDQCERCHGEQGQGVNDGYAMPFDYDQSLEQMTQVISETMPEEDPESCVGEDAVVLARYIREQFASSSKTNQTSQLTRLTVAQYRNVLADLIGRFTPAVEGSPSNRAQNAGRMRRGGQAIAGLRGEYFQSEGMNKAQRLGHYRSDTYMAFDFGQHGPVPSIDGDQFAIVWQGSLRADHTGDYQFRLTTENGARLYLNFDPRPNTGSLRDDRSSGDNEALIDDWVGSGKKRQKAGSMFLLGGRDYPIRLEFFKYLEPSASVKLEWKPPHGTWSVLDFKHLTTDDSPRTFACDVPFPPDDRSLGFERGSSVSEQWQASVMKGAIQTASEVAARLPLLASLDEKEDRTEAIVRFAERFTQSAFRRELDEVERERINRFVRSDPSDLETGLRKAIVSALMSPYFLYPEFASASQSPSPEIVATRLSLALWDSFPDDQLISAAKNGQLDTADEVKASARRMLRDPRAKTKMRRFFGTWLEIEDRDLSKDAALFPEFDEQVVAGLRESLEIFIDDVVWSRESDYRQLLLASEMKLNQKLAELYRPDPLEKAPSGATETKTDSDQAFDAVFRTVRFDERQRSGIITHPYLLSAFAYHDNTSPIHRGVFLTRNVVGRALSPPPNAIAFKDDEFPSDLTMREKVTLLTRDNACMACHSVINPLGFTLESFDAVGRWRELENQKPVDTQSLYTTVTGDVIELSNARDVAKFAVRSPSAHLAFITHLYEHMLQRSAHQAGDETLERLRESFANDDFNIQNLCTEIAVLAVTRAPQPNSTEESR
ncbi:DUF1592 domain-containing protein [Rhodopirellula sp. MGV]|uniref:DUF1592 domain-containing protein n=1 Tax=Rhodopirellula sp. MGV TaxID=2023130 RepID=UPI000B97A1D2|nr:DUF1592 domain-containing protein [Rhodopirellula sp. MGV]OYP36839.1 hypothetical protein CGZ80_07265 [Rhodopirellula sp. MGV]PNY36454.1 DUF1592 domain-containing protein [Rhodopirellula baltica]